MKYGDELQIVMEPEYVSGRGSRANFRAENVVRILPQKARSTMMIVRDAQKKYQCLGGGVKGKDTSLEDLD